MQHLKEHTKIQIKNPDFEKTFGRKERETTVNSDLPATAPFFRSQSLPDYNT